MRALPITGEYPPDWKEISDRVWAEAGHRCIRCGHPYRKGEHGKGATRRKRVRLPEIKQSRHPHNKLLWVKSATYGRDFHKKGRSKYESHIGEKQIKKISC